MGTYLKEIFFFLVLLSHKRNIFGEKDGEEATRPWWAALARAEAAVPLPREIERLELYRRPHSAERQHYQAGSLETSVSQIGHACGFCSLSHAHSPLENIEGKGKKYN